MTSKPFDTYRIVYQIKETDAEVYQTIGTDTVEGMYRLVKVITKTDIDQLHFFEAHRMLEGGEVEVLRGGSPIPRQSTAEDTEETKPSCVVIGLLDQKSSNIKEDTALAYPYRIRSVSEVVQSCLI